MTEHINLWRNAMDELTMQQPNALAAIAYLPKLKQERDLLRAENTALLSEASRSGKILERLDRAGSWGVMVNAAELQNLEAENAALRDRAQKLEEALTPSVDTKSAYMGEVKDNGKFVSWDAIKQIMKMVAARAI